MVTTPRSEVSTASSLNAPTTGRELTTPIDDSQAGRKTPSRRRRPARRAITRRSTRALSLRCSRGGVRVRHELQEAAVGIAKVEVPTLADRRGRRARPVLDLDSVPLEVCDRVVDRSGP